MVTETMIEERERLLNKARILLSGLDLEQLTDRIDHLECEAEDRAMATEDIGSGLKWAEIPKI